MHPSPESDPRDDMLYFHYDLPEGDRDPDGDESAAPQSLQGVVKEDADGTFVMLDWLQASKVRDSLVMRLPRRNANAAPPQSSHPSPESSPRTSRQTPPTLDVAAAEVAQAPETPPPTCFDVDLDDRPSLATGLAVGLGVNLLVLLAGAFLLKVAVPTGDLQVMERAIEQSKRGNWSAAIALAQSLPPESPAYSQARSQVEIWQTHQAREATANSWIAIARDRAQQRDFQGAIAALDRVPPGSSAYGRVAPKLAEYRRKRDVRATWLLQRAYDAADRRDFAAALAYLQQIPPGTPASDRAGAKRAQYRQQQNVRATWLLQQAYDRAVAGDFQGAIAQLRQIPAGTEAYAIARSKLSEYRRKASQRG